jgi:hypothetical protein
MCIPIAAAALAATIGSTVMSAINTHQQAKAQQASLNMQAATAQREAAASDAQAKRAEERADQEARRVGAQQADVRGRQQASMAANGIDLTYGSAQSTLEQTDYYGLSDQMTAQRNGADEASAYRDRAGQLRANGGFLSAQANSISPGMQTAGTLLAGGGKVAERWSAWSKS